MSGRHTYRVRVEYHATIHDETGIIIEEVGLGSRTRQEAALVARRRCAELDIPLATHQAQQARKGTRRHPAPR